MKRRRNMPGVSVERRVLPGMQVTTLCRQSQREVLITAVPIDGENAESMFGRVAGALRDSRARVVSLEVFGISRGDAGDMRLLADAFERVSWPTTWIGQSCQPGHGVGGVQVWAVAGVPVEPVELHGRLVGSVFEDDYARYCRLGGLLPADPARARGEQARQVLEQMEAALRAAGMQFGDTLRTWFYNDDILSWYGEFNAARNAFFRERRVFDGLVPASTGVGAPQPARPATALVGGLLAVKAKDEAVCAVAVPSALQCPAPDYGSSFSRATELALPDHRRLFVSGTAGISPDGQTAHVGDVDAQIALTMDVVRAILESRGMGWSDVVRAVGHFKRSEHAPALQRYCAGNQAATMPIVLTQNEICRDDLLFELEVDAVAAP